MESITVRCIFENGVLRPLEAVPFVEGQIITATITLVDGLELFREIFKGEMDLASPSEFDIDTPEETGLNGLAALFGDNRSASDESHEDQGGHIENTIS